MNDRTKIGTCGFRITKEEYVTHLSTVEVQHTFYQPPQISTLERWRAEVPENFEFTLKAWQLITHDSKSPTYKRMRRKLTESEVKGAGSFRPSDVVDDAWQTTLACAQALRAKTVLFQCPASFKPTDENVANLEKFFGRAERDGLNFCWEPRGAWDDELIRKICSNNDLWHAVDPFSRTTVTPDKCYFRLHGRNRWRYEYEDSELKELATLLPPDKLNYIFFNNISMTRDAQTFEAIVKKGVVE